MEKGNEIEVSSETLERLKSELEELTTKGRDQISERLRKARELGDLKENADYHASKEAQGLMEARIRKLQNTISNAAVREGAVEIDTAAPGVIVKIREVDDGDDEEYLFASSPEERIEGIRTITMDSPLGKALAGKSMGDQAVVKAPGGEFSVEILEIRSA